MVTVHHRFAQINGHNVYYREAGIGNAENVLLLHGAPASSFMFRDLIPVLAERYHVIAPDYPGFGLSDCPAEENFAYTFDHLAQTVELLLKQLQFTNYAMYVQDYGAPIGWRLAIKHPENVAGIITQNGNAYEEGFVPGYWDPLWAYAANPTPASEEPLLVSLTEPAIRWQYLHGVPDPTLVSPDTWLHDTAAVQRPGSAAIHLALYRDYPSNRALYPIVHDYFRQHRPPMLVVWGEGDEIFQPEGARAFLTDLPNAQLHLVDGGHFLLESDLAHVSDLILTFLAPLWQPRDPGPTPAQVAAVTIRPAGPGDLAFIARGERACLRAIDPAQEDSWAAGFDRYLDLWVENLSTTFIATSDDTAVGYVMWAMVDADAMLVAISVLPSYQRSGIGRRLLNLFIVDANKSGAHLLRAGAHQSNPARTLYETAGFEPAGTDDEYLFYSMHGDRPHQRSATAPLTFAVRS